MGLLKIAARLKPRGANMKRLMTCAALAALLAVGSAQADWTNAIIRNATREVSKAAVDGADKSAKARTELLADIEKENDRLPYTEGMTRYTGLIVEGNSVYSIEHMDFAAEDTKAVMEMARQSMGKPGLDLTDDAVKTVTEVMVFDQTADKTPREETCKALVSAPESSIMRRTLESGMSYVQLITSGVNNRLLGVREFNSQNCKF